MAQYNVRSQVLDELIPGSLRNFTQPQADLVPMVLEKDGSGERAMDLFSRLLKAGLIDVTGPIEDSTYRLVTSQLVHLSQELRPKDGIKMYLHTPGGSVYAGLAIYQRMQEIQRGNKQQKRPGMPIQTVVTGLAASMGSVLIAAGTRGRRLATPTARIMVHQPLSNGGRGGPFTHQQNDLKELEWCFIELAKILSRHSGMPLKDVVHDFKGLDMWLSPEQAKSYGKYGLIDKIIGEDEAYEPVGGVFGEFDDAELEEARSLITLR